MLLYFPKFTGLSSHTAIYQHRVYKT